MFLHSVLCVRKHQRGHIRLSDELGWAWGSFNGVKITKHLLYYTGVCLFLLYKGASPQLKLLRLWVETAQLCIPPPFSPCPSYILSRLPPHILFVYFLFLMLSLLICHLYLLSPYTFFAAPSSPPFVCSLYISVRPVCVYGHQEAICFFFCYFFFLREMFWG